MMTDWWQMVRIRNRKFKTTKTLALKMVQLLNNYNTVEVISICHKSSRVVVRGIRKLLRTRTLNRHLKNKVTSWSHGKTRMVRKQNMQDLWRKPWTKPSTTVLRARLIRTWRMTNSWHRHRYTRDTRVDNPKFNLKIIKTNLYPNK